MNLKFSFSLIAFAIMMPAVPAAAQVQDFKLPPAPTSTQSPAVQGPVDTEGPVPIAPRVIPTDRPSPAPVATPAPRQPAQAAPRIEETPASRRFTPATSAAPGQRLPSQEVISGSGSRNAPIEITPATPDANVPLPPLERSIVALPDEGTGAGADSSSLPSSQSPSIGWGLGYWLILAAGLLAVLAALFLFKSRRSGRKRAAPPIAPPSARRSATPQAETVEPDNAGPAASKPVPSGPVARPIDAAAEPVTMNVVMTPEKLSRSMMNVTLSCVVTLGNSTEQELRNVVLSGDLVTAHGKVPISEQLADTMTPLPDLHAIASLGKASENEIAVTLNLPINQIRPIAQGRTQLYVPLLRLRISAEGNAPILRTFVIGIVPSADAGKVQPFRLDEMPQTYTRIGSRLLD